MALTNDDVQKQIKNMISFIKQEAKEKVDEINSKADEEFEIEKSRLVQDQRSKMNEFFSKEEKKLEQRKKIQHSNMMNQARLKILGSQQEHVKDVLEEAQKRLHNITSDPQKYKETLKSLIIQGLFQLLEEKVIIRCCRGDIRLVEVNLDECVSKYEAKTGMKVELKINKDNCLPDDLAGGVELWVPNGRVKIVNTLESRLELISQQLIPEIREILFGKNTNRIFHD